MATRRRRKPTYRWNVGWPGGSPPKHHGVPDSSGGGGSSATTPPSPGHVRTPTVGTPASNAAQVRNAPAPTRTGQNTITGPPPVSLTPDLAARVHEILAMTPPDATTPPAVHVHVDTAKATPKPPAKISVDSLLSALDHAPATIKSAVKDLAVEAQTAKLPAGQKKLGSAVKKAIGKGPLFNREGPGLYRAAYRHNKDFAKSGPYQTQLGPKQERQFRQWVDQHKVPFDPNAKRVDYDMRGFFKATGGKGWKGGHFPDTFKTPFDTTFSRESKYATPDNPFVWRGDRLVDRRNGRTVFGQGKKPKVPLSGGGYHGDMKVKGFIPRTPVVVKGRVKTAAGHKVLGTPSLGSVNRAMAKGTLKVNKRGMVTTPQVRSVISELRKTKSPKEIAALVNQRAEGTKLSPKAAAVIRQASKKYGVPPGILTGILDIESDFGGLNSVTSSAGAKGWAQFIDSTWKAYGVDANKSGSASQYELKDAVNSEANYLRALYNEHGNWDDAIYGYNHAGWYVQDVKGRAAQYGPAFKGASVPPQVMRAAKRLGLAGQAAGGGGRGGPTIKGIPKGTFTSKHFPKDQPVDLASDPGNEAIRGAIAPVVGAFTKKFDMDILGGWEAGHASAGHTQYGTATDVVPRDGNWGGKFAQGIRLLTKMGFVVGYDGSLGTIADPDHGPPGTTATPHAHIEWASWPDQAGTWAGMGAPGERKALRNFLVKGGKLPAVSGSVVAGAGGGATGSYGGNVGATGAIGTGGAAATRGGKRGYVGVNPINSPLAAHAFLPDALTGADQTDPSQQEAHDLIDSILRRRRTRR